MFDKSDFLVFDQELVETKGIMNSCLANCIRLPHIISVEQMLTSLIL